MGFFGEEYVMPGQSGPVGGARSPASGLNAILQRAGDMLVQRMFPEAIEILEGAVETDPSSVQLHQMLATAYIDSRRIPDAKRELDLLRELGVKDPKLTMRLAVVSLGMRQFDDAIFYFRESEAFGAERGEWCILFGNALWQTGQLSEAEEIYQEVLPVCDEHRYDLFAGLSAIRLQQDRYSEAAELAWHALKCNKPKTRAVYFLGLASMRMGEPEKAILAFQNFVRMQPNYVAPYRWLERLARELGNDAEADAFNIKAREMLESRRMLRLEKQQGGAE